LSERADGAGGTAERGLRARRVRSPVTGRPASGRPHLDVVPLRSRAVTAD